MTNLFRVIHIFIIRACVQKSIVLPSVLGSTKNNKVENDDFSDDSQLNSISFVESKNQVHKSRFELLKKV